MYIAHDMYIICMHIYIYTYVYIRIYTYVDIHAFVYTHRFTPVSRRILRWRASGHFFASKGSSLVLFDL